MKKTYTLDEIVEKIEKHQKLNGASAIQENLKGNEMGFHEHIGAMTGLEILKKDLKGGLKYDF